MLPSSFLGGEILQNVSACQVFLWSAELLRWKNGKAASKRGSDGPFSLFQPLDLPDWNNTSPEVGREKAGEGVERK